MSEMKKIWIKNTIKTLGAVFGVFGYKKCTPETATRSAAGTGCRSGSRWSVVFVSYKGVCIDLQRANPQSVTVSFRVFTPPGWMQWQATQWSGLTSISGGVLERQPSQM